MGQFYFGDNVDKWVNFKLALTLSDLDYIRHGWQVKKVLLGSKGKAHHVPFGEWAITE